MRFARSALATLSCAALAALALAPTAAAAEPPPQPNQIVVFQFEFKPVTVFRAPSGCYTLPLASHVMINQTDRVVTIYHDPLCVFPIFPVHELAPGNGTHVSPVGSFSV